MSQVSLSRIVVSQEGEQFYTFEYAAHLTQTSTHIIECFVELGLIEPSESIASSSITVKEV